MYVPLYNCGWLHECILECVRDKCRLNRRVCAWMCECMVAVIRIEWCFRVECFPDALIYKGRWRCSAAPRPLHKSSVPPPALTVSQPLSDWTGSKGSLSLSVSILHIDLNDYYTLTTAAPLVELTSAFTSTQTVSLHTQPRAKDPPLLKPALDSQEVTLTM